MGCNIPVKNHWCWPSEKCSSWDWEFWVSLIKLNNKAWALAGHQSPSERDGCPVTAWFTFDLYSNATVSISSSITNHWTQWHGRQLPITAQPEAKSAGHLPCGTDSTGSELHWTLQRFGWITGLRHVWSVLKQGWYRNITSDLNHQPSPFVQRWARVQRCFSFLRIGHCISRLLAWPFGSVYG